MTRRDRCPQCGCTQAVRPNGRFFSHGYCVGVVAPAPAPARTFSGTTHDGIPVVVTVHDAEGVADLAFADATGRFGPAVELSEEQA